jgi:FlaG/FlaF family flagellin (archaellin)
MKIRGINFLKRKKGLSNVVSTMILIALAVATVGIVASYVISFVNKNLEDSGDCFEALDKIQINNEYTCLWDNSLYDPRVRFTAVAVEIEISDLEVDKLLISLSGEGESKTLELINGTLETGDIVIKDGGFFLGNPSPIIIPTNGARTYVIMQENYPASGKNGEYYVEGVKAVKVAPVINGEQCSFITKNIETCSPDLELIN